MRIAVATDDRQTIAAHTGRCAAFAIYEVDDGKAALSEVRENRFTGHAHGDCEAEGPGSHRHHSHAGLLDAIGDCCVLISRGMGPRLVADLGAAGIDVCVCDVERVDDAVQRFARGDLPRLDPRNVPHCRH